MSEQVCSIDVVKRQYDLNIDPLVKYAHLNMIFLP